MRYRALLWDIDDTLLDFGASERAGILRTFESFGLGECTEEMLKEYSRINMKHWEKLERGECTKRETMVNRFREFFELYGITADAESFNDEYQDRLPDTIIFHPHGKETLELLSHTYLQYSASNGNLPVQLRKLRESGMDRIFNGVFISDDVGFEKPSIDFFRYVLDSIGQAPEDCLMIGDSLTSDMLGANNAGIPCCWFNPKGKPAPASLRIDYTVRDLAEIPGILERV